jgi:hypothetical protein
MALCDHLIERRDCYDCSRRHRTPAVAPGVPGPWCVAEYWGSCAGCGADITPGDEIRADGYNGWQGRCCGGGGGLTDVPVSKEYL